MLHTSMSEGYAGKTGKHTTSLSATDLLLRGALSIVALHLYLVPGDLVKLPVCSLPQVWVHILHRQSIVRLLLEKFSILR